MCCINIIKGLYNRSPQLLRNPMTLDRSVFDSGDAAVTLLRIVVAGIDYNYVIRHSGEQIARQVWNVLLRMVTITTSARRAASLTETGVAPVSAARSARLSGPRELATNTL